MSGHLFASSFGLHNNTPLSKKEEIFYLLKKKKQ